VLAAALFASVAGCARPEWTDPERSKGARTLPAPARAAIPMVKEPPPPFPGWVEALMGQPLRTAFPGQGACQGNTDAIAWAYPGRPGVAVLVGWAWDTTAKAPPARVVLTDPDGMIVGGGATGVARLDVPKAMPAVTSTTTGWQALSPVLGGRRVSAWAIVGGGRAVCPLGGLDV
jgi:hypothetical protein